jgi:hypothetical protein
MTKVKKQNNDKGKTKRMTKVKNQSNDKSKKTKQ